MAPLSLPLTPPLDLVGETPILLQNSAWQIGVLPGTGASLAFGRISSEDGWTDLLRPTPDQGVVTVEDCSSFALLPWSNRVGGAVLDFAGRRHRLRVSADDGSALHGTAREFPWTLEDLAETGMAARFDSRDFSGVNYPWSFSARSVLELTGRRFTITLSIRNEDVTPIPVGLGHHPYFRKALAGPRDQALLEIPCSQYFELNRALPTGPPAPVSSRVDFRSPRPLGGQFVDDCLTGRTPGAPIRLHYPVSGRSVTFGADDVFTHVVVYIPQESQDFAVEPVTNANDAFTLHSRGIPGSGLIVLEPGQEVTGSLWLEV
jgi:aldose 1-epimerase